MYNAPFLDRIITSLHPILINNPAVHLGWFDEIFANLTIVQQELNKNAKIYICYGATDSDRTGTMLSDYGILSPGRLPIQPLRNISFNIYRALGNTNNQIKIMVGHQGLEP